MNFLEFNGTVSKDTDSVTLDGVTMPIPKIRHGASGDLTFGIRPEHISFNDSAGYRGRVIATEYLGTTQIVVLDTPNGVVKARIASSDTVTIGETIGLAFHPHTVSLFDAKSGKALLSEANERVLRRG